MDELVLLLVIRIPVAIDRQHFFRGLVNRNEIRGKTEVVFEVEIASNFKDRAQTVFVVVVLLFAFDLVVGLLWASELRLLGSREVDIAIHASIDALLKLKAGQVLHMGLALCAVEARCAVGKVDIVDRHEEAHGAALLLVPHHLHVLHATKRHLRGELLKL